MGKLDFLSIILLEALTSFLSFIFFLKLQVLQETISLDDLYLEEVFPLTSLALITVLRVDFPEKWFKENLNVCKEYHKALGKKRS